MKQFTLTERRKLQLKQNAKWAGFKVGFSEDNRFAWIVINDHGDCRFMKAAEVYESWKMYECMFIHMVNTARQEMMQA